MEYTRNTTISPEDAMRLGEDYFYGQNNKNINISEALKYFNIAAKQNNSNAEYMLGTIYFDGLSVSKNLEKAVSWFEKAVEHKHAKACLRLAMCYENGWGIASDHNQAIRLCKQALALGETEAGFVLSRIQKDFSNPIGKKAHSVGNSVDRNKNLTAEEALFLGKAYYFGENGKEIDYAQAIKYYNIAAKQNNAEAEYVLGTLYFDGIGVPKNFEKAASWFGKAASHKHAKAHLRLAQCYEKGLGVPQNRKQALHHYEQALALGEQEASFVIPRIKQEIEDLEHEKKVLEKKKEQERIRESTRLLQKSKLQKKEEDENGSSDVKTESPIQEPKMQEIKQDQNIDAEDENISAETMDLELYEGPFDDTPNLELFCSDFSVDFDSLYSSYESSYDSSYYVKEMAEEMRRQTELARQQAEEARRQTQIAQQQQREMQKQRLKEGAEERKRRLEEVRQKHLREIAIDSRCRSCSVIGCGMKFNRSNVNCAGYRPKR